MKIGRHLADLEPIWNITSNSLTYTLYRENGTIIETGFWSDFDAYVLATDVLDFSGVVFMTTQSTYHIHTFLMNCVINGDSINEVFNFNGIDFIVKAKPSMVDSSKGDILFNQTNQVNFSQRCWPLVGGVSYFHRSLTFVQEDFADGIFTYSDFDLGSPAPAPTSYSSPAGFQPHITNLIEDRNYAETTVDIFQSALNGQFGDAFKIWLQDITGTDFSQLSAEAKIEMNENRIVNYHLGAMTEIMKSINDNLQVIGGKELGTEIKTAIQELSTTLISDWLEQINSNLKVNYDGQDRTLPEIIVMILNTLSIF